MNKIVKKILNLVELKSEIDLGILINLAIVVTFTSLFVIVQNYFINNYDLVISELDNLGLFVRLTCLSFWSFIYLFILHKLYFANLGNWIISGLLAISLISSNLIILKITLIFIIISFIVCVIRLITKLNKPIKKKK